MTRVCRHLLTAGRAGSLLLAAAVAALWLHGLSRCGHVVGQRVERVGGVLVLENRSFDWGSGRVTLSGGTYRLLNPERFPRAVAESGRGWAARYGEHPLPANPFDHLGRSRLGFQYARRPLLSADMSGGGTTVVVPCWSVLAVLLAWPLAGLRGRALVRRRAGLGLCLRCGYDLRASPGRCPECGAAAA